MSSNWESTPVSLGTNLGLGAISFHLYTWLAPAFHYMLFTICLSLRGAQACGLRMLRPSSLRCDMTSGPGALAWLIRVDARIYVFAAEGGVTEGKEWSRDQSIMFLPAEFCANPRRGAP